MTREEARQTIRDRISCKDYLTKSKSGLYECPFCGSGTGNTGTGALKVYDTNTWYCHKCEKSGDVIDLYMNRNSVDFNTALHDMAEDAGIIIDRYDPRNDFDPLPQQPPRRTEEEPKEPPQDHMAYYRECTARITDPAAAAYLAKRGISEETARHFLIGYDPAADPAQSGHPTPRIIIPTSRSHYVGRSIDPMTEKGFQKMNNKGGTPGIFNAKVLHDQEVQEVFVCEGAFDAMSIIEAGAAAIALNSTSNAKKLIDLLTEKPTTATLILCLDNDKAGKEKAATLAAGLQRLNISFISADVCGSCKDPNEALTTNRAAFLDAVEEAKRRTAAKPDSIGYYLENLMPGEIEKFHSNKRTGFDNLDKAAGGLYSGLYCVAAISSLGKTTFTHQIADQLAAAGNDVLFFSLEQSRLELVSKSIARKTAQMNQQTAVTSLAIRGGYMPRQVIEARMQYAQEVQDRLSIIEGNFNCDISFIGQYVRQYIQRNHTTPVLVIDYLQVLQPAQTTGKQTTKEIVDTSITELKRLSRELDLTIFVISSVNRANYLTPIDFESLKESGNIEYTADVIWGLQLQCLNDPAFDKQNNIKERREKVKEAKAANPRKIELVCLKNRFGIANFSCYFNYDPRYDLFEVCPEAELDFPQESKPRKAGRKL